MCQSGDRQAWSEPIGNSQRRNRKGPVIGPCLSWQRFHSVPLCVLCRGPLPLGRGSFRWMSIEQRQKVLIATWDGAGNNPPVMTLGSELVARGHSVHVLRHESTRGPFEQGGLFFTTWANTLEPPFIRHYMPEDEEYEWATEHIFVATAYQDELRLAIEDLEPDVVLVDHALRYAILEAMRADQPLVVLCHIPYSAMVSFEGEDQKLEAFKDAVRRDGLP